MSRAIVVQAVCDVQWRTPGGDVVRDRVQVSGEVFQATSQHARARRMSAYCAGYRAQREGAPRASNPHQHVTGGWSRPLERCWYAGWDYADGRKVS